MGSVCASGGTHESWLPGEVDEGRGTHAIHVLCVGIKNLLIGCKAIVAL